MRIVHIITRLIIGGAQENTILSCEGLRARGHDIYLWSGPTTGPEGSLVARASHGGYAYEEFPDLIRSIDPSHDLRALRTFRKRLKQLRPDVVHTHSSKAGVIGRIAATRAGVPRIVHTIHGMSFNRTQRLWTRMAYALAERFCAHRCHAIVSVADAMTRQALAAGIGTPEQYETIHSGMETEAFDPQDPRRTEWRARWKVGEQDVLVGTVARLFANKGYEQLMETMTLALQREPRLRFVWVGGGDRRRQYEAELSGRGLSDRVILTGLVKPEEIPGILSAVDILAHTSQWEGLPRAVVQAMLMEKPVVSFAIDGAPEVVRPGETGELVALGDLPGFAGALVTLAGKPGRRAEYGRRGRRDCLQLFNHHVMVDRLEQLYGRLPHQVH
jgi:glycosyltransferase involved in cell wall biosynthesis